MMLNGLSMRLKKLKSYNSKFFIYFIFIVFNFSVNASECKNVIFSKSKIFIENKKDSKKSKFYVELADTKLKRETGLQCKKELKKMKECCLFGIQKIKDLFG